MEVTKPVVPLPLPANAPDDESDVFAAPAVVFCPMTMPPTEFNPDTASVVVQAGSGNDSADATKDMPTNLE
jgi:hypothetical protein